MPPHRYNWKYKNVPLRIRAYLLGNGVDYRNIEQISKAIDIPYDTVYYHISKMGNIESRFNLENPKERIYYIKGECI